MNKILEYLNRWFRGAPKFKHETYGTGMDKDLKEFIESQTVEKSDGKDS